MIAYMLGLLKVEMLQELIIEDERNLGPVWFTGEDVIIISDGIGRDGMGWDNYCVFPCLITSDKKT